jgi:hypothetical protein
MPATAWSVAAPGGSDTARRIPQGGVEGDDARAAGLQGGGGSFEDPDVTSGVPEHQCCGQATQRAPHDDDPGHRGHRLWSFPPGQAGYLSTSCRMMTLRWMSLVPSPTTIRGASR